MKKVLVTEPIHEDGIKLLQKEAEVIMGTGTSPEIICREAGGCQGILIRSAQITGELINKLPELQVIAKHGIGVDNIDVQTATAAGVLVVNAPESNTNAVAEHALGMILALAKHFVQMDSATRKGGFGLRTKVTNMELRGKTVGLIGLGKIAMLLVKKLQALDVNLLAYDPYINPSAAAEAGIELVAGIDGIFSNSDIVSVHVPLTEQTRGMIGKNEFGKMKKEAFFVNVSRGPIVNEQELYEALKTGEIKGAALDVFAKEPPALDNPLFSLDNVLLSPHNAALTDVALVAMATHAAQGIVDCLAGRRPRYMVNPEVLEKA